MDDLLESSDATAMEEEKTTAVEAIGIPKILKFAATGLTCDLCV